jgi:glycosyltransferase involved in cell wall biosynthesis
MNRVAQSQYRDSIQLPGFIEEEALPLWYSSASALVFPSLIEGFGLPVAEAMASGTLVLSSDRGSLPEVGGAAPIYFNPESLESLLVSLETFSTETEESQIIRMQAGCRQAEQFDWDLAAKSTCIAYIRHLSIT